MAGKEKEGVITGVYKVNLHCPQCAGRIKKPLLRSQGVHSVDVDFEKSEIKVKGVIDVIIIHKLIEKSIKKKVELISPHHLLKIKDTTAAAAASEKKTKEKELILRTTTVKVHIHCEQCERDLRKKLLKHKGIYSVKTDKKAQTVIVQGSIESENLLSYFRKKVHKHAEIVKEGKKVELKSTQIIEFKAEEEEEEEVKCKESSKAPYFIHYVYAPQLFSDENPNACSIL